MNPDQLIKHCQAVTHHKRRISIALIGAGTGLLDAPRLAQGFGDSKRGSVLVLHTCVACHGVRGGDYSANSLFRGTFAAIASQRACRLSWHSEVAK